MALPTSESEDLHFLLFFFLVISHCKPLIFTILQFATTPTTQNLLFYIFHVFAHHLSEGHFEFLFTDIQTNNVRDCMNNEIYSFIMICRLKHSPSFQATIDLESRYSCTTKGVRHHRKVKLSNLTFWSVWEKTSFPILILGDFWKICHFSDGSLYFFLIHSKKELLIFLSNSTN